MTAPLVARPLLERWAGSGAMALTGTAEEALGPPSPLVGGMDALGAPFDGLDALALLGERAALGGLTRNGTVSCGGGCRLLPAADGWLAVSLPRPEDVAAVPAWLELPDAPVTPIWDVVAGAVAQRSTGWLLDRARLLQLAVASLGERDVPAAVSRHPLGGAPARPVGPGLVVVDLTSLWAGPLCGDLLARAGATVVKVESTGRPDGARRGPAAFFDLMNGAKRSMALDFGSRQGVSLLRHLIARADVVLEASRPRALEQLGLTATELVAGGGPQVWVSITGFSRAGADRDRSAFGDDAAVAGGACLEALAAGGRWLLDVSMAGAAAALAGPTLDVPDGLTVAPPRARPPVARAAPLGRDTRPVLDQLGIAP
jgi:hypothetical protein